MNRLAGREYSNSRQQGRLNFHDRVPSVMTDAGLKTPRLQMDNVSTTSTQSHSTLASVAATLVSALESCGVDYRPLLIEAGLDPDAAYNPSEHIRTLQFKRLREIALRESAAPCFGLTCAACIQPSSLHGLGLSWIASHTLKEGLKRLIRLQKTLATDLKPAPRETHDGYCIYDTVSQVDDPFVIPAQYAIHSPAVCSGSAPS